MKSNRHRLISKKIHLKLDLFLYWLFLFPLSLSHSKMPLKYWHIKNFLPKHLRTWFYQKERTGNSLQWFLEKRQQQGLRHPGRGCPGGCGQQALGSLSWPWFLVLRCLFSPAWCLPWHFTIFPLPLLDVQRHILYKRERKKKRKRKNNLQIT